MQSELSDGLIQALILLASGVFEQGLYDSTDAVPLSKRTIAAELN